MKIKTGNMIAYKDPDTSNMYGIGVVTTVTEVEYTILWARRGARRYKRAILDQKLDDVFQREDKMSDLPKEKHLLLGTSKIGIPFNENYDRLKVKTLCATLLESKAAHAKDLVGGLTGKMFTNKLAMRAATRTVLQQLAELCSNSKHAEASNTARQISQELFFGYIIQKSDFAREP
ncbi:MAG TPA: hypothetical protein VJQ56_01725 [Blastocatellia bacterium]|nr:hypothetical protein [Blastocatellia bacterium]